jgi:hypothetical protein
MRLVSLVGLALMVAVVSPPLVARAADPDPRVMEEAAARYDRGVKLYEAGDYPAALAEFEAVYKLTGRWEVLYNIALTQKKLFRYGASVRTFERYLVDGGAGVPKDRRDAVERELAEIRALVAEVTVIVPGAPARLDVDGNDEGQTPLDRPLLLGPGKHTVRASRDGELDDTKVIDVVSGQRLEVRLEPRPRPVEPKTATVKIDTRPSGAILSIDEKTMGPAPWQGELPAGGHAVTATKKGYKKARQELIVIGGQNRTYTMDLEPLPVATRPIYKKWWFWTIVGAGVAAGTGTFIYLESRPDYDNDITIP